LWTYFPYPDDDHNRRDQDSQDEQIPTIGVPDCIHETVRVLPPGFISYRYRLALGERDEILWQHRLRRKNCTSDQHGNYSFSSLQGGGHFQAMVIHILLGEPLLQFVQPSGTN